MCKPGEQYDAYDVYLLCVASAEGMPEAPAKDYVDVGSLEALQGRAASERVICKRRK